MLQLSAATGLRFARAASAGVVTAVMAAFLQAPRAAGVSAAPAVLLMRPSPDRNLIGWSYAAAPSPEGGFSLAWIELDRELHAGELHLQQFDPRFQARGTPILVGSVHGCQGKAAVASTSRGGMAALWCDTPSARRLLVQLRNEPTEPAWTHELAGGAAAGWEAGGLSACGDRLMAVSTSHGPDSRVRAQLFDLAGQPLAEPLDLGTASEPSGANPATACGNGHLLAAWSDERDIWTQAFAADGSLSGPRFRVSDPRPASRNQPKVAMDASGAALFTWLERSPDGVLRVMGRRFHADGSPAAPSFPVSTSTRPSGYHGVGPGVAFSRDGALFVWEGVDTGAVTSRSFGRWFETGRDLPIEEEFRLGPEGALAPTVSPLAAGDLLLAWAEPPPSRCKRTMGSDHRLGRPVERAPFGR
jgi:hypothetical protein